MASSVAEPCGELVHLWNPVAGWFERNIQLWNPVAGWYRRNPVGVGTVVESSCRMVQEREPGRCGVSTVVESGYRLVQELQGGAGEGA